MDNKEILKKNERYHIIEGALYISTGALISTQTLMPALITRLGGNDVLVGAWPVVIYLAFFFPQVISANYSTKSKFRKPTVIKQGLIQRFHILILGLVVALLGNSYSSITLTLLFLIFISNQIVAGIVSPIWMDFLAKTTPPETRGKLMGWRTSIAAAIGLFNGIIVTALLTFISYPFNYASAIVLAGLYQIGSLIIQRKVVENTPSVTTAPVQMKKLFFHVSAIISNDIIFKKFLIASSFVIVSFASAAFFTVAAMKRFTLTESSIGLFTILTIIGQIISGVILGWVADNKGTKTGLVICSICLFLSIFIALVAPTVEWFYLVFILFGINLGVELFMRYNYAIECAQEKDRSMYVGLMNAWFAPFYAIAPIAGWLSNHFGYNLIFAGSLFFALVGTILLARIPNHIKILVQKEK